MIYLRQIYIKTFNYAVISLQYVAENAISKLHKRHLSICARGRSCRTCFADAISDRDLGDVVEFVE